MADVLTRDPPPFSPALGATLTGLDKPAYTEVHAFWLAGMSCDGCTIAVSGATKPSVEELLTGTVPGLPKVILHHPVLSVEVGHDFTEWYYKAWRGELDAPYVIVMEGSVPDERIARSQGGYFAGLGAETPNGEDDPWAAQPVPISTWISRLAPGAAASIAVGTCATWGGIPAATGNPTGSMGLMDYLGVDYKSALGLPVINIPGCSPTGDNMTETIAAVLMFLEGIGPLPEFDELGRPAWLFKETVHRGCTRAGYYEEGVFAEEYGGRECLVEIGCWGPVVQCNIVARGAINGVGGCMQAGGVCIGCTMPGFPDTFSPFYKAPPGAKVSGAVWRVVGTFIRPLRRLSQRQHNLESRWLEGVPSGWARVDDPSPFDKVNHFFYEKLQFSGSRKPGTRRRP
ncbi:hydrogenase small subunit [soil metagenome]|nr:hydrogenase expression protein HypE [Deinococcota bacterium]